ncbi:TonB family protein [Edaphobacter sp. HDX4]|uniref:TonB family protein n=1 Tax=Edaphobacter sp. HDX4 TaxID=2794064 RepID=UPI002FE62B6A
MTALKNDRHFAMDFWAMAGDLSARERGVLSDDEMLLTLVEGSTGLTIAALPLREKIATAELKNLLAGVDVESPLESEPVSDTPATVTAETKPSSKEEPFPAAHDVGTPDSTSSSVPDVSQAHVSIAEALRRLEETSRELREQLAAIEELKTREVSRDRSEATPDAVPTARTDAHTQDEIEPQKRSETVQGSPLPAADTAASTANIEVVSSAPHRPGRDIKSDRKNRSRSTEEPPRATVSEPVVFAPRPYSSLSRRGLVLQDLDDDPSIPVPLSTYTDSTTPRVRWGVAVLLVLILLIGGAWLALHYGYGQNLLSRSREALRTKVGLFGEELHDLATPLAKPQGQQQPAPSSPQQPTELKPSQASDAVVPPAARSKSTQNPTPPTNALPSSTARPDQSLAGRGAVRVPAAAMEANLISSRVPVYPEAAKAMEIEGPVLLDVVISRTGAVDYVRVIQGDSHLRAAAEEAVRKWRYKPYLLNGRPVAAVTQVRIVFRLP